MIQTQVLKNKYLYRSLYTCKPEKCKILKEIARHFLCKSIQEIKSIKLEMNKARKPLSRTAKTKIKTTELYWMNVLCCCCFFYPLGALLYPCPICRIPLVVIITTLYCSDTYSMTIFIGCIKPT